MNVFIVTVAVAVPPFAATEQCPVALPSPVMVRSIGGGGGLEGLAPSQELKVLCAAGTSSAEAGPADTESAARAEIARSKATRSIDDRRREPRELSRLPAWAAPIGRVAAAFAATLASAVPGVESCAAKASFPAGGSFGIRLSISLS
jgi:hypothetical protein